MALPAIVSEEEWLEAPRALLQKEKAATRARDALNTERRNLPMVEVNKDYRFTGPEGENLTLRDLFKGRHQLMVGPLHVRARLGGRLPQLHGGRR